jgi:hypothetical protein
MLLLEWIEDLEGQLFGKATGKGFVLGVSEMCATGADGRGDAN